MKTQPTQPLTPAEEQAVDAIVAEIRQRPGYFLARAWIDRTGLATSPPTDDPTGVYRICSALQHATGAQLTEETVAVALEDAGVRLTGFRQCRDGTHTVDAVIDERIVLDQQRDKIHGVPASTRCRVYSDDQRGPTQ